MLHLFLFLPALATAEELSPPAQATEPDGEAVLLDALIRLLNEGEALAAVDTLEELGDHRAIDPLVHTARTRREPVARAAARALASFPEASGDLAEIMADRGVPEAVRVEAARSLGRAGNGAELLIAALEQGGLGATVRTAAAEAVRTWYPDHAPRVARQVSQDGTLWLMAGGATALGFTLGAAGHFGQAQMEGLGVTAGAVGGATLGWVWGRTRPMEAADAAFLTTSGAAGVLGGALVADATEPFGREHSAWIGGLMGEAVGFGLGYGLRNRHMGTPWDSVEAIGVTMATAMATASFVDFLTASEPTVYEPYPVDERQVDPYDEPYDEPSTNRDQVQLAAGIGILAGMTAGHLAAPHVELVGEDWGVMALSATWGNLAGNLLPVGHESSAGLGTTGFYSGALLGYGLARPLQPDPGTSLAGFAGLGFGAVGGLGLGELMDLRYQDRDVLTLSTATGGMLTGAALGWLNPAGVDGRDVAITGIVTGWSLWQTAGWLSVAEATGPSQGLVGLVPAVTGASTAIASPLLDVGMGQSLSALSLGLWGLYVGGVAATLADAKDPLAWMLTSSNIGLGTGAVLMSPLVDASPVVVGLADAGGVLGASGAALVAAMVTPEQDPILIASLAGAGLGSIGGAGVGLWLERNNGRGRASMRRPQLPGLPDIPGRWQVAPLAIPCEGELAWGAGITVDRW